MDEKTEGETQRMWENGKRKKKAEEEMKGRGKEQDKEMEERKTEVDYF